MPVEAGQVIAERYRLVRPIGKGAQAAVWIAEHLALGSQVAVKLMDAELVEQADARERFRREATAAAQLRSAHVVHILDHGIENGQPFMVMEYLEGEDLFQRLERKGRLTLAEASVVVTHIARALARAHAAGIVHRDLKPENVYLVPNEDEEIAKVLDFGVAKFLEAGAAQRRTSAGTLLGTPHYMSPEQVRGVGEIDHRSDLWSLGVIAYQLTVGDLPFESEGVGDLLIKITMEKIPVPSKAYAPLPKSFDEFFAKACDRDPDKRFQTGRELAEALARVAGLIPAADSMRGMVPAKGRSEPPAFDVDFDEQPSIPPPPAPPPPDVAKAAAPAAPRSDDVDEEWPDEPPSPSMPPPPLAAAVPAAGAATGGKGPPPRPGAFAAKAPAAPPKPAPNATAKLATSLKDMPTRGPRLPPPTAAELKIAPPSRSTEPDPEEVRPSPHAEMPPPPPDASRIETAQADTAQVVAAKAVEAKATAAAEPAPTSAKPASSAPLPAPRAEPAPPPRPGATPSSKPPAARTSDPPRSRNQLSSTISGAAGDVIPPPELDGSRKKRAVLWVAALMIVGAAAIAIAVVRSQGTDSPQPSNATPRVPTAEPKQPVVEPPPAPVATPSSSSSTSAASSAAVEPGTSKRPIKGGPSAAPVAPRPRPGGGRRPPPPKDGEIVIDVPLPDREVPVPPSP